jgi:tellurium resistance protein TerD
VSSLNKGVRKAEVALKWDPSPLGESPHDLDLVAATYPTEAPFGDPAYVVHFDSRSPDGTIILARESGTGQGFGADEVMTLEFDRLASAYGRVVVGVVIQQSNGRTAFGDVVNASVRILEGHTEIGGNDFATVPDATAATVGEFVRGETGEWTFSASLTGFDADPHTYLTVMGRPTG